MFIVLQDRKKEITLGDRRVWIPLAIIALSIAGSGIIKLFNIPAGQTRHILGFALATTLFGAYLFGIYLVGRILGSGLFTPFSWAIVIGSLGCLLYGILYPGVKTGGFISPSGVTEEGIFYQGNYDIATGLLVFGTIVSALQRRWWLTGIAIVGLFFTGAAEAIFVVGVLLVVVIIRGDFSRKLLVPVGTLAITLIVCTPLGITQKLYMPSVEMVAQAQEAVTMEVETEEDIIVRDEMLNEATGYRWLDHWRISPIKPFGYGYNMTAFYKGIPHNIVLIIIEQVGVVAAIAWLWIAGFCLIKTRWKYAWAGLIALGVFDHFIWTQVAPWFWALVGVSIVYSRRKDYIFKEV
jgi:hypothetical protein